MTAFGESDRGCVRTENEDRLLCDPERGIFAVIDGVGGHVAGEVAAQETLEAIRRSLQHEVGTAAERVAKAIWQANNAVYLLAQSEPHLRGMTCVMTLAMVSGRELAIGHVGDTRLYKLTRERCRKLTRDHSPVGEREDRGELSESEAMRHPRRNEVFRDVGSAQHAPDDDDFIEIVEDAFEPESALVLCSDGLTDMVTAAAMDQIVRQHAGDPERVVKRLIDAAKEAGGRDNVTVVYVEGSGFARAVGRPIVPSTGQAASRSAVTEPLIAGEPAHRALPSAPSFAAPERERHRPAGRVRNVLSQVAGSRLTALFAGAVGGVVLAALLVGRLSDTIFTPIEMPRTLTVGGHAGEGFRSIGDAIAAARRGDSISIAPGEYPEQISLKDGVSLFAREPRSVVVRPPEGAPAAVEAVDVLSGRVSGLVIRAEGRIATGVRVAGSQNIELDDLEIAGAREAAVAIADASRIVLRSSYLHGNGRAVEVRNSESVRLSHNVIAGSPPGTHAVVVIAGAPPEMVANVFSGPDAERNFIIEPKPPARPRGRR
ncbi:MAG: protein phosphatase 2C domain-containing protein [Vicinamibacterales bacterium]